MLHGALLEVYDLVFTPERQMQYLCEYLSQSYGRLLTLWTGL